MLREGNVLILANTTLDVAEACSGIRSLVSLLTLGIVLGYFTDPRGWVRIAIALSSIPVAIVANGVRVAGTGIAAHHFGPAAAEGFFHTFSGWLVFLVAFAMLVSLQQPHHARDAGGAVRAASPRCGLRDLMLTRSALLFVCFVLSAGHD